MSALKNLPPHVARELRRHISPHPLPKRRPPPGGGAVAASATGGGPAEAAEAAAAQQQQQQQRVRSVLAGCVAFTVAAGSLPLVATYWIGGLTDKDGPLTAPQVRRGAFQNSGTRDVGRDPNWDFATGQYKKDSGYAAMYENERRRLPGEFLAVSEKDLQKHEEKIEAFAMGRGKNN
jgi:hypothetical protein